MTPALTLITPPGSEPLARQDLKDHLRVTHDDEDALLDAYLTGAREALERATGLALMHQTWEAAWRAFPCASDRNPYAALVIPRPPLLSVTSVKYFDTNGVEQTLAGSEYTVDTRSFPGEIVPAYGKAWPATRDVPNAVVVKFVAGFGDEAVDVPEAIRGVLRLEAGTYYLNREELSTAAGQNVSPTTLGIVRRVLGNYQPWVV